MEEADGGEGGGRFTPEIRRKESTSTGDPRSQGREGRMISCTSHGCCRWDVGKSILRASLRLTQTEMSRQNPMKPKISRERW